MRADLHVEGLTGDEVTIARKCGARIPSLPDAFAYSLASVRGWTLLTGDGELRALAQVQKVPFFGVLWLLDQFFEGQVIEAAVIIAGLGAIATHPRCRLPKAEIQARLERYRKAKG